MLNEATRGGEKIDTQEKTTFQKLGFNPEKPFDARSTGDVVSSSAQDIKARVEKMFDPHFTRYEDRLAQTPAEGSSGAIFKGARGESKAVPNMATDAGRAAAAELSARGQDGIDYRNADPDFSKVSEGTVKIDHMCDRRRGRGGNFEQADTRLAETFNKQQRDGKTNWTPREIEAWRKGNRFIWHERADMKTMDLVPEAIHKTFTHSGGVAECKARDAR